MSFFTPRSLGLPSHFTAWRPGQLDAINTIIASKKRFIILNLPTGAGKSVIYVAAAKILAREVQNFFEANGVDYVSYTDLPRTLILTSTRALQDQLGSEFGFPVIKGKVNYRCALYTKVFVSVDLAPCAIGNYSCGKRDVCEYQQALERARTSTIVVSNYAFWTTYQLGNRGDVIGKFDLLICDEAHDAPEWVCNAFAATLDLNAVMTAGLNLPPYPLDKLDVKELKNYVGELNVALEQRMQLAKTYSPTGGAALTNMPSSMSGRELRVLMRLRRACMTILDHYQPKGRVQWIYYNLREDDANANNQGEWVFTPVWPRDLSESALFSGVDKVVLSSATIRGKTANLLGIDNNDVIYYESRSTFPVKNRPLIHVPTIRLTFKSSPNDLERWTTRIMQIIRQRQDRKGIIHAVSYARAKMIEAALTQATDLIGVKIFSHTRRDLAEVVAAFKDYQGGAVLVSPSVVTGYDFPDNDCRYQVIGKIAFPDSRDKLTAARQQQDKSFGGYLAMINMVQAYGRGVRGPHDWAECFIIDDNISWFIKQNAQFAPEWFHEAFQKAGVIPRPTATLPQGKEDKKGVVYSD